jgi:hypothetical protein
MKEILNKAKFEKVSMFVKNNARPLDIAVFKYIFENDKLENAYGELKKYQNLDYGLGKGLEPDFKTPISSNMATAFAFQYFHNLNVKELPDFLLQSLNFFNNSYNKKFKMWYPVPKEVNDTPHAIWWEYNESNYSKEEYWGNPTVEIIGYLMKYKNDFDKDELENLKQKAIERLLNADTIETHELQCYSRLISLLDEDNAELAKKMEEQVVKTVEQDPRKWQGYVTKPSAFIQDPKSKYFKLLESAFEEELNQMIQQQEMDGGWYPSWQWPTYPETWKTVQIEIAGMLTVKNLILLKRFNRIEL